MNKLVVFVVFIFGFYACIPIKITPNIENFKVVKAKKFNNKLPKTNAFVFKDPKKTGEIHKFIHAKFNSVKELDNYYSFNLNGITHAITFYEVEKETKTVNLIPIIADVSRKSNNKDSLLEDFYISRKSDNWYVAITVSNEESSDCLSNEYANKKEIEKYLEAMKNDYLNTSNYIETLLLRK